MEEIENNYENCLGDYEKCRDRYCSKQCKNGQSHTYECSKCWRPRIANTSVARSPKTCRQTCQDECQKCSQKQCKKKCADDLKNGQDICDKCLKCREEKCRDDCVTRGNQTKACTECRQRNHIFLTPVPTGKGVLLHGNVQSAKHEQSVLLILKRAGIPEDAVINTLLIKPIKKRAPSQTCGGGC